MIEKREEILNSSLSLSSPPEANHSACSVGFSQAGYRKPAGSVGDSWVLEIIAGKGAVKEKRSVQVSKLSTTEKNWIHFASWGIELNPRYNLLTKYRYINGKSPQCVSSRLYIIFALFTPFFKTEIIKPFHLNRFSLFFWLTSFFFFFAQHLFAEWFNFSMELKSCPSLKGNERRPLSFILIDCCGNTRSTVRSASTESLTGTLRGFLTGSRGLRLLLHFRLTPAKIDHNFLVNYNWLFWS